MELGPLPPLVVLGTGMATLQGGPPSQAPSQGKEQAAFNWLHMSCWVALSIPPQSRAFLVICGILKKKRFEHHPLERLSLFHNLQMGKWSRRMHKL